MPEIPHHHRRSQPRNVDSSAPATKSSCLLEPSANALNRQNAGVGGSPQVGQAKTLPPKHGADYTSIRTFS